MTIQPTLPPEGTYTDAELEFISHSPPGLWPENQDSNFGQVRKIVTDVIQERIDELDGFLNEAFVATATDYLSMWEDIVRVPINPTGKTVSQRRSVVAPRLKYGPFTEDRIAALLEDYLVPTFGPAVELTPGGVELTGGGVPLYSGINTTEGMYAIYFQPRTFTVDILIRNDVGIDTDALEKELARTAPGGYTINVDNSQANILDYYRGIISSQPVAYYRLHSAALAEEEGGYNLDLTNVAAAPAAVAAPGLLAAGTNGAADFNGSSHWLGGPHHELFNTAALSVEFIMTPDALNSYASIAAKRQANVAAPWVVQHVGSALGLHWSDATVWTDAMTPAGFMVIGEKAHFVVTRSQNMKKVKFYKNGVLAHELDVADPRPLVGNSEGINIGRTNGLPFIDGKLDEVAIYNRPLSAEEVAWHYYLSVNGAGGGGGGGDDSTYDDGTYDAGTYG